MSIAKQFVTRTIAGAIVGGIILSACALILGVTKVFLDITGISTSALVVGLVIVGGCFIVGSIVMGDGG
jgi:hypothetical protein